MRIRFAGFGGQGVVLCGFIFGKAAMLDGKNSIHTQSYGSASRGGLTKSDVAIQDDEIYDLVHDRLDVLVVLSQQSHDANRAALLPTGLLFYETDLVQKVEADDIAAYGLSATDIAHKEFGRKIMANMIMVGFVNQVAQIVSRDSLASTITESVPRGTEEKNLAAFAAGMRWGEEAVSPSGGRG